MKMEPKDYVEGLDIAIHHMAADIMRAARTIADEPADYGTVTRMALVAADLQEVLAKLGVKHKHMRLDAVPSDPSQA